MHNSFVYLLKVLYLKHWNLLGVDSVKSLRPNLQQNSIADLNVSYKVNAVLKRTMDVNHAQCFELTW